MAEENILDNVRTQQAGLPVVPEKFADALKMLGGFFSKSNFLRGLYKKWSDSKYQKWLKSRGWTDDQIDKKAEEAYWDEGAAWNLADFMKHKMIEKFNLQENQTPEGRQFWDLLHNSNMVDGRYYRKSFADQKNPGDNLSYFETAKALDAVYRNFARARGTASSWSEFNDPGHVEDRYNRNLMNGGYSSGKSVEDFKNDVQSMLLGRYGALMSNVFPYYDALWSELNPATVDAIFGKAYQLDPLVGVPIEKSYEIPRGRWHEFNTDITGGK